MFHKKCIKEWFNRQIIASNSCLVDCPYCKREYNTNDIAYLGKLKTKNTHTIIDVPAQQNQNGSSSNLSDPSVIKSIACPCFIIMAVVAGVVCIFVFVPWS
jgi:hypothetical protein